MNIIDRLQEQITQKPGADILLLGRKEYAELIEHTQRTDYGRYIEIANHVIEIQWNHFVKNDFRLFKQYD